MDQVAYKNILMNIMFQYLLINNIRCSHNAVVVIVCLLVYLVSFKFKLDNNTSTISTFQTLSKECEVG